MDSRFADADAAFKANRPEEGIALLTAALSEGGGTLAAYRQLGAQLYGLKRYAEAEQWMRTGVEQWPKGLDLWNILGVALRRQGRYDEALVVLEKAHKLDPKNLMPLTNKANVLNDLGEGARALEIALRLVRQQPTVAEHHRTAATAYRHLGQLEAAAARLDVALKLSPQSIDLLMDRATVASLQHRLDEAIVFLERGLKIAPDHQRLFESYVIMLRRAGRMKEAEAVTRGRIGGGQEDATAHLQLARTLQDTDRRTANVHFQRAVELDPDNIKLRLALADSLDRSRHGDEGANIQQAYETVLAAAEIGPIPPEDSHVARQITARMGDFSLTDQFGTFADNGRRLAKGGAHGPLLLQLARVRTAEDRFEVLHQHRLWGETVEALIARNPIKRPAPRPKDGKIRLGLMSSDLRNHPVGYFVLPLFQNLDRARFELYCYSFNAGEGDATQEYFRSKSTVFRLEPSISSRAAAELIAGDQLDMLIELGGSTHMNKLDVMAFRPAPLQASWLGYPHSAGLADIDYIVTDPYITPKNPKLLIEKPMVMPHTWLCLGAGGQFRDSHFVNPVTPEERNGFITFGSANNPHKYGPDMLRTWARVVASVPNAQFFWVRPEAGASSFRDNMRAVFAEEGVGPERVRFQAVRGAHLPFYNDIDIALDTFPLTGGTTTCETIWMGVPVVSMVGEALFERLSYSILSNAGLGDLVATNPDEFVAKALALAADPARRMLLRATLREQIKASPLGQAKTFADDFYDLVAKTVAA